MQHGHTASASGDPIRLPTADDLRRQLAQLQLVEVRLDCRSSCELTDRSVSYYKGAAKRGNTLAMANLAYALMDAGFFTEAQEWLERANEASTPHPSVAAASSAPATRRENDSKQAQEILQDGQRIAEFMWHIAEAGVKGDPTLLQGTWFADTAQREVTLADGQITATWAPEKAQRRFTARVDGAAAKATFQMTKYLFFGNSDPEWEGDGHGYIYAAEKSLHLLRLGHNRAEFESWSATG